MIGDRPRHGSTNPGTARTGTAKTGTPKTGARRSVARPAGGGGKRAPRVPFALLVTGLVLGAMALLLALNTFSAANELRRHDLALKDEAVAAEVEQLQNEVAASAAPANLASAAAALGMVPAGNPAFIVDVAGKLVVRGKPAPVPYPVIALPTSSSPKPAATSTPTTTPTTTPTSTSTTSAAPTSTSTTSPSATATTRSPAKGTTAAGPSRPATTSAGKPAGHRASGRRARTGHAAPQPSTPAPTPTVTLPGGPR